MESPVWHVPKTMSDIHLSKTLALDMPDMTKQTDWQAKQPSQVAWKNLNHWSHEAERCRKRGKEEVLDDLPWKDERGTLSIQWRLELFQYDKESKATLGNFLNEGVEHIPSWTELNNRKIVPSKHLNLLKVNQQHKWVDYTNLKRETIIGEQENWSPAMQMRPNVLWYMLRNSHWGIGSPAMRMPPNVLWYMLG